MTSSSELVEPLVSRERDEIGEQIEMLGERIGGAGLERESSDKDSDVDLIILIEVFRDSFLRNKNTCIACFQSKNHFLT